MMPFLGNLLLETRCSAKGCIMMDGELVVRRLKAQCDTFFTWSFGLFKGIADAKHE